MSGSPGWWSATSAPTGSSATPAEETVPPARPGLRDRVRLQPPDGRLALHRRQNATVLDPPELAEEVAERLELLNERHSDGFEPAESAGPCARHPDGPLE